MVQDGGLARQSLTSRERGGEALFARELVLPLLRIYGGSLT